MEKLEINLNFDDKYLLNIDKEILGKLIQDLEQCSKSIKNLKNKIKYKNIKKYYI